MEKPMKAWFTSKNILYACIIIVFAMMLLLNCVTPMTADDYYDSYATFPDKVDSFAEVISTTQSYYMRLSPRWIAFALSKITLWLGKPIFNPLNALAYTCLMFVLYKHIVPGKGLYRPSIFVLLNALVWFLLPAWGQDMIWMVGSVHYLWTTLFIFIFLLPYRMLFTPAGFHAKKWFVPAWFFMGIFAGCGNENTSAMCTLLIMGLLLYHLFTKKKLPAWCFSGGAGCLMGFISMLLCPGIQRRMTYFPTTGSPVKDIIINYIKGVNMLMAKQFYWVIGVTIVLIFFLMFSRATRTRKLTPVIYLLGSMICHFAMVMVSFYPLRTQCGVWITLITACLMAGYEVCEAYRGEATIPMWRALFGGLAVSFSFFFLFSYSINLINSAHQYVKLRQREAYILRERDAGNLHVLVPVFSPLIQDSRHCANPEGNHYDYVLIYKDGVPVPIARYFGVESITKAE